MVGQTKFVAKLFKYRILFKNILIFLGIDYRDASLIILYLVVIGISTLSVRQEHKNLTKSSCHVKKILKVKNQHVSNGLSEDLETIVELLRFLNRTLYQLLDIHHAKFEIDSTILNCLNQRKELIIPQKKLIVRKDRPLLQKSYAFNKEDKYHKSQA